MTISEWRIPIIGVGVVGVIVTLLGAIIVKKLRKEKIPYKWQEVGTVKDLILYPLKSGKGLFFDSLFVTTKGLKELRKYDNGIQLLDRSFLIYTSKDREVRTARQFPKSVLIELKAVDNGVILSASGKTDLFISIPKVKDNVKVTFGQEFFACTDCGDSAAKWISSYILEKNEGLRIGFGDGRSFRNILKYHHKWASFYTKMDNDMSGVFSDLSAVHMVNEKTVEDLNSQFPDDQKVSFMNFRPNILVKGPEAFAEEKWEYLKIGDAVLKVILECLRCIESTVDQDGIMSKKREPLTTLERHRNSEGPFKNGVMGIYLKVLQTGKISKGDRVYVS